MVVFHALYVFIFEGQRGFAPSGGSRVRLPAGPRRSEHMPVNDWQGSSSRLLRKLQIASLSWGGVESGGSSTVT